MKGKQIEIKSQNLEIWGHLFVFLYVPIKPPNFPIHSIIKCVFRFLSIEVGAIYGTSILDVDYTIANVATFTSDMTKQIGIGVLSDDDYESEETLSIFLTRSPVEVSPVVEPIALKIVDQDFRE